MTNHNYHQIPGHHHSMGAEIPDISTAGSTFFVPGFRGKIRRIAYALNGAITTADATLTTKINGVAVSNGTITVAHSGSAEGDTGLAIPTENNVFEYGEAIELETDGASSNPGPGTVAVVATYELEPF